MPSAIRQYFSSYDPPAARNDGFLGPPQEGPPDDNGGGVVQPPAAQPRDASQLASFRANRIRDYLAQNPNRRPGPMGRNPDGSINWDTSTGVGADGWRRSHNGPAPGYLPTGPDPKPTMPDDPSGKRFNAAVPRGG